MTTTNATVITSTKSDPTNQSFDVCTREDDYTRELWLARARWTAQLSNGEIVIQDDGRDGTKDHAWSRLRKYVYQKNLKINRLQISFRNETPIILPENAEGYFFRRGVGGFLGNQCDNFSMAFIGYVRGDKVYVGIYRLPDLTLMNEEERDTSSVEESIIYNREK